MKVLTYAIVASVLLASCSSGSTGSDDTSTGAGGGESTKRAASTTATSTAVAPTVQDVTGTINTDRCGSAAKRAHPFTLRVGAANLPAARLGSGPDVAILLHQTDGDAACGWLPAAQLMAARGTQVVVFDMCGYGGSHCDDNKPPTAATQVTAAVTWARQHGAARVTVVGASMGGSVALGTARQVAPQAVVDLSGPMSWDGVQGSATAARSLRIPLLAAASPDDPDSDAAALKKAVASNPGPHHRFVRTEDGHGIEMLTSYAQGKDTATPLLGAVVRWVKGNYA